MIKEYLAYLKDNPQHYWFKRKPYGWGWTPATWQGWVTLLVFVALLIANAFRIDDGEQATNETIVFFILETFALVSILIFICYKTGEKPRWQWGWTKSERKGTKMAGRTNMSYNWPYPF